MKCPSCGAEVGSSKYCEFCGTQISSEMRREQEKQNIKGCPQCGSSNIQFRRENQGEIHGKQSKQVIHRTVGVCKDCGATWYPNSSANEAPKKRKTWLWVLGWLCIFPVPLTILMLRKKNMKPALKYSIIAVAWIIYLLIGLGGNSSSRVEENVVQPSEVFDTVEDNSTSQGTISEGNRVYSAAEIVDLMNGFGTEKVGTITVVRAEQSACTEDALADWYFNYVLNHSDCNYHLIVYSDNPTKGVYSMGSGFIQKDIALIEEPNGTYALGDDAGSTYYTIDPETETLTLQLVMADKSIIEEVTTKVDEIIPQEYKTSDFYSIDISGEEGNLDCNLTIINERFVDADYQSIATELADKIKNLDLGIGYFCIAFQSDDYTLSALSTIDDLSAQEVSFLSTIEY